MAFSTQKDFMEVGFMNSSLEAVCQNKGATKLKTYPSTTDTRAWSPNNKRQANFFADIVACRTYVPECELNKRTQQSSDVDNNKDIKQLQDIINNLKKENAVLRGGTVDTGRGYIDTGVIGTGYVSTGYADTGHVDIGDVGKGGAHTPTSTIISKSTNTIAGMVPLAQYNKIVEERNKLNDKLSKMVGLEDKISVLKQRAMEADKFEQELKYTSNNSNQEETNGLRYQLDGLNNQCCESDKKIQDMQMQLRELNGLKIENNELMNEMRILTRKVERMQCLEDKLYSAEHQLCCNERIIQDYEYQFNQLMIVIEELEGKPYCSCDSNTGIVKDGHFNDLTLATIATIDQIKLEMCARGKLQEEIYDSKIELATYKDKAKMDRDQFQKDRDNILNETSSKCSDILKQLAKCREENKELKKFVGEVKSGLIEELSGESLSAIGENKEKSRKETKPTDSEMDYNSEVEMLKISESDLEKLDEEKPRKEFDKESEPYTSARTYDDVNYEGMAEDKTPSEKDKKKSVGQTDGKMKISHYDKLTTESARRPADEEKRFDGKATEPRDKVADGGKAPVIPGARETIESVAKPGSELVEVEKTTKGKAGPGVTDARKETEKKSSGPDGKTSSEIADLAESAKVTKPEAKVPAKTNAVVPHGGTVAQPDVGKVKPPKSGPAKADDGQPDGANAREPAVKPANKISQPATKPGEGPEKNLVVADDIEKCRKALDMLKKEFREAKDKHDLEKLALETKIAENQKLREQLLAENEKYKTQQEKSKDLLKEKTDLESKKGNLQNKLTESNEALLKQKGVLGKQNELLAASKAELERLRAELIKSKDQIISLEGLNKSAEDANKKLNDDVKTKKQEIATLNDKIKELMNKAAKLEENIKIGDSGTKSMADELANLKKTIANLNVKVENKEAAITDANNKIKTLQSEKETLSNEIKQNRKDLTDIQTLVGDIETQRKKNKELEALVKNYENKLSDVGKPITSADTKLEDSINELKKQLEQAEANNNKLVKELKQSKDQLKQVQSDGGKAPGVASTSISAVTTPVSARKSVSRSKGPAGDAIVMSPGLKASPKGNMSNVNSAVKEHVKSLQNRHSKNLIKLQNIYGDQMKDLIENHEKELQAMKGGGQIRGSLKKNSCSESEEVKKLLTDIKSAICTCKKLPSEMTRLERICRKIIDKGIEYLTVKELTHLHGEVYKAGLRLKPELLKHCDEKQKCCKCTDFSCCLPHLSKEMEKKLISRIIFLENEVEKANKILLHLKNKYSTNYSRNYSHDTYKFNDDLNDLLKTFCPDTYKKTTRIQCLSCADLNNQYNRKCKSARLMPKNRKHCDIPTRD